MNNPKAFPLEYDNQLIWIATPVRDKKYQFLNILRCAGRSVCTKCRTSSWCLQMSWGQIGSRPPKTPCGFDYENSVTWIIMRNTDTLQWPHNECDGVSHHQLLDCLLNRLFMHRSKTKTKLLVTGLCEGNPPVTGGFSSQGAVTRKMFPFDDVIMSMLQLSNNAWERLRGRQPLTFFVAGGYALSHHNVPCATTPPPPPPPPPTLNWTIRSTYSSNCSRTRYLFTDSRFMEHYWNFNSALVWK